MKDIGITNGEWMPIIKRYPENPKEIYIGVGISKKLNDGVYTTMICDSILPETDKVYIAEHKKIKADMTLIADAGNTAQSCGLLPSELLKQNEELREALKELLDYPIDDLIGWSEGKSVIEITLTPLHIKKALLAITKAEERWKENVLHAPINYLLR